MHEMLQSHYADAVVLSTISSFQKKSFQIQYNLVLTSFEWGRNTVYTILLQVCDI